MKRLIRFFCYVIFWLWNGVFSLLIYGLLLPTIGVFLVQAVFEGLIPVEFFVTLLCLFVIPVAAMIFGASPGFRSHPFRLFRLFYGVEAPLLLLLVLRLFLLRERTLASTFIIETLLICIGAYAIELCYGYAEKSRPLAWAQLLAHSLMMLVAAHVSAMLFLHVLPIAVTIIVEFFRFRWLIEILESFSRHPESILILFGWGGLFLVFFALTMTLFIMMPAAFVSLHFYSGGRVWQKFASQYGKPLARIGTVGMLLTWIAGFTLVQHQPHVGVFERLKQPPQTTEERRTLVEKSKTLRKGLLNAYLFRYRYLSTMRESNAIRKMYRDVFRMSLPSAQVFQDVYNFLAAPFLYQGESLDDEKAAALYAEFFDEAIQRGERQAIQHAIQSTYNRDEVKAGLLDVNEERVWLAQQQITVEPHGSWANVEVYDVYENQTNEVQEVLYSFSLPESAVITGLWLGDSEDRTLRYEFQVSPRGAAQQVYNAQVQRRQDPALLEQVGPRHYRLRAFPIPARPFASDRRDLPAPRFHLWLTYKVLRQENTWPLPYLGEKRNVYWTKKTQCNYNGYTLKHPGDTWLPESLQANISEPFQPYQAAFPDGYVLTATPLQTADYRLPQGKRLAVLLDTSYSMAEVDTTVEASLNWLQGDFSEHNTVDLYMIDAQSDLSRLVSDIRTVSVPDLVFYGSVQFQDMLSQFSRLRGERQYDVILAITDTGSYELAGNEKTLPPMPAPLWMVHLGGLPQAYDDTTLQAIETSGGGVGTNVIEVLQRLAAKSSSDSSVVNVVDGYIWRLKQTEEAGKALEIEDWRERFEPFAARQLILGLSKQSDMNLLERLDFIHSIAKHYEIVSPYSSMIVLVNQQQKEALEEAERQTDRFEREVEDGKETLSKPSNPMHQVSAVPEPGTAGLFLLGLAGLGWARYRKRT